MSLGRHHGMLATQVYHPSGLQKPYTLPDRLQYVAIVRYDQRDMLSLPEYRLVTLFPIGRQSDMVRLARVRIIPTTLPLIMQMRQGYRQFNVLNQ